MNPATTGGRRAGLPTATANKIPASQQVPSQRVQTSASSALPIVFATLMLAAGGASYDWLVVKTCPFCGFAHRHTRFERTAQAIERSPSCAPHRAYQVRISDVVPARRQGRAA
jgi:hypothetical protein